MKTTATLSISVKSLPDKLRGWLEKPWLIWLLLGCVIVMYIGWCGFLVVKDKPIDFYVYYMAAYGLRHDMDIFDYEVWEGIAKSLSITNFTFPYQYPPLTVMLMLPLSYLAPRPAMVAWLAISSVALILSAWLLGTSTPFPGGKAVALALLLGFMPALTTLHAGQVNGLVLLSLCAALYALCNKATFWGGISLALGTMLKLLPMIHLGYVGWQRKWRAIIGGGIAIIIIMGLAFLLIAPSALQAVVQRLLHLGAGQGLSASGANQSLGGFSARLVRWTFPNAGPGPVRVLWISLSLVIAGATMALCWPQKGAMRTTALTFALVTTAANLVMPYTWYHQYVLLLIPFFVLAVQTFDNASYDWMLIPLIIGYGATSIHGVAWHTLENFPLLVSLPFYTALTLWGLLAWLIIQKGKPQPIQ